MLVLIPHGSTGKKHILSIVIFVELLVVEVNHLEIVKRRLRAASRRDRGGWGLRKTCPEK